MMAISHDRSFLERPTTHILTVRGGTAVLEERALQESDWQDDLNSRAAEAKFAESPALKDKSVKSVITDGEDATLKKLKFNVPKRLMKIEKRRSRSWSRK